MCIEVHIYIYACVCQTGDDCKKVASGEGRRGRHQKTEETLKAWFNCPYLRE